MQLAGLESSAAGSGGVGGLGQDHLLTVEGLGAALTLEIAHAIRKRGDEAFLHAVHTNDDALRLYRALGFEERCRLDAVAVRRDP